MRFTPEPLRVVTAAVMLRVSSLRLLLVGSFFIFDTLFVVQPMMMSSTLMVLPYRRCLHVWYLHFGGKNVGVNFPNEILGECGNGDKDVLLRVEVMKMQLRFLCLAAATSSDFPGDVAPLLQTALFIYFPYAM